MPARGNESESLALEVAVFAKICTLNKPCVTTICSQTFVSEKLRFCFQGVEQSFTLESCRQVIVTDTDQCRS
jgi:hypothetical protein